MNLHKILYTTTSRPQSTSSAEDIFINKFSLIRNRNKNYIFYEEGTELLKKEFASKKFIFQVASDPASFKKLVDYVNKGNDFLNRYIYIKDIYGFDQQLDTSVASIDNLLQIVSALDSNYDYSHVKVDPSNEPLKQLLDLFPHKDVRNLIDQAIANRNLSLTTFLAVKKEILPELTPAEFSHFANLQNVYPHIAKALTNYLKNSFSKEQLKKIIHDNQYGQLMSLLQIYREKMYPYSYNHNKEKKTPEEMAVDFFKVLSDLNYTIDQCFSDEVLALIDPYSKSTESVKKGMLFDFVHHISSSPDFKNGVLNLESLPIDNEGFKDLINYYYSDSRLSNSIKTIKLSGTKIDELPAFLNFKNLNSINMGSQALKSIAMAPKFLARLTNIEMDAGVFENLPQSVKEQVTFVNNKKDEVNKIIEMIPNPYKDVLKELIKDKFTNEIISDRDFWLSAKAEIQNTLTHPNKKGLEMFYICESILYKFEENSSKFFNKLPNNNELICHLLSTVSDSDWINQTNSKKPSGFYYDDFYNRGMHCFDDPHFKLNISPSEYSNALFNHLGEKKEILPFLLKGIARDQELIKKVVNLDATNQIDILNDILSNALSSGFDSDNDFKIVNNIVTDMGTIFIPNGIRTAEQDLQQLVKLVPDNFHYNTKYLDVEKLKKYLKRVAEKSPASHILPNIDKYLHKIFANDSETGKKVKSEFFNDLFDKYASYDSSLPNLSHDEINNEINYLVKFYQEHMKNNHDLLKRLSKKSNAIDIAKNFFMMPNVPFTDRLNFLLKMKMNNDLYLNAVGTSDAEKKEMLKNLLKQMGKEKINENSSIDSILAFYQRHLEESNLGKKIIEKQNKKVSLGFYNINEGKGMFEQENERGIDFIKLLKDEKLYEKEIFPILSAKDAAASKKLRAINIYLSGHLIKCNKSDSKLGSLQKAIDEIGAGPNYVRYVVESCHAAGEYYDTIKAPGAKVCGYVTTDSVMGSYFSDKVQKSFWKGFFTAQSSAIENKKEISFAEAVLNGIGKNYESWLSNGRISSDYYIHSVVLKKPSTISYGGAYRKFDAEIFSRVKEFVSNFDEEEKFHKNVKDFNQKTKASCKTAGIPDTAEVSRIFQALKTSYPNLNISEDNFSLRTHPAYKKLIKFAEKQRKELIEEGLNKEPKVNAAVEEFKKFIMKDFSGSNSDIIRYGMTKNYPLNKDFFKIINFAKLVDRLRELEEFEKVATPEQTKKLLDLLECEWALI